MFFVVDLEIPQELLLEWLVEEVDDVQQDLEGKW